MISFFRRILSSWMVLGLFGIILIAFIVTGVNLPDGSSVGSLGANRDAPANIGRDDISAQEVLQRTQATYEAARRENPELTLPAFVRAGALEQTVDQMLNLRALERFANDQGIYASKRLIDAEIASIPAFRGPTGEFDRNAFLGALSQQRLTEAGVRLDIGRDKIATMVAVPLSAGTRVPAALAGPYAAALLETREGLVANVTGSAMPKGKPATDAEVQAYYKANIARYTAPETRTLRYARFDKARFAKNATPTESEIAAAYKAKSAQFASKETRVLTQVIVPDQAAANAIAAKIKAGTAIDAAAKAAGSEATTLAAQDKSAYAGLSSATVADAAFAAAQGAVTAPVKSGLGWHVVRVDKINLISGKSLADVRGGLVADLVKSKTDGLLATFITRVEDAIADGSTFEDIVKAEGLTAETTPAITAAGTSTAYKLPDDLTPILRDAFQAELDDDASVISIVNGEIYALYDLDRIIPAAPRPIATVSDQIRTDIERDRAGKAARAIASAILAKVNSGTPIAEAVRAAGVSLPAPQPLSSRRIELESRQGNVPATLTALFALKGKQARLVESPEQGGWSVVYLANIVRPAAAEQLGLIQVQQQQMARTVGEEYTAQFTRAIRTLVNAQRNPAAIDKLKRDLGGTPAR